MSYERSEVEALVRKVITRTLGLSGRPIEANSVGRRPVVDAEAIRQMPSGSLQQVAANALVTPLARQAAMERHIRLEFLDGEPTEFIGGVQVAGRRTQANSAKQTKRMVTLGADHGGYGMKETLKALLETPDSGYSVFDCGTHSTDSVDYPDYAYAVARLVADGQAWRGIIIDGAGIGSCMAANKVPGVRAALCYDQATAVNSREHNNANVLTLGAGLIGPSLARQIVETWLATEFGGGRHARRVDKIDRIGQRFAK
jgi:ribose 5-phosphate isomerase B